VRIEVVRTSPLSLPPDCGLRRDAPRKRRHRQAGYDREFDWYTIFYDVFFSDGELVLSGPPVRSIAREVRADVRIDGRRLTRVQLQDQDRTQCSRVPGVHHGNELAIKVRGSEISARIQSGREELLAGQRVLMTLSKDNNLNWIFDWVSYHVECHGTDAVLFYDNASTVYSVDDIANTLASVPGLATAVIVCWPFKYGPQGGTANRWDSDFCQYGMLEHARRRFLRHARSVVNADVDELVMPIDDRSVYEVAEQSSRGYVQYAGQWISSVPVAYETDWEPSFDDYLYQEPGSRLCAAKWCLVPQMQQRRSVQWRVHDLKGRRTKNDPKLSYRHFRGVSTGWKYSRHEAAISPPVKVVDLELQCALANFRKKSARQPNPRS
jgi:hypothetical protein